MKNKLELLFEVGYNQKQITKLEYQQKQKDRWSKGLEKVEQIYDKLKFLNDRGIVVEKVLCTEFNQNNANNGMYPFIRFHQFITCFEVIHDNPDFELYARLGSLSGKYNCETLINKIVSLL